ncbi:tetratricopeptide repeat protein [Candidatus Riflebacteria bacterium]
MQKKNTRQLLLILTFSFLFLHLFVEASYYNDSEGAIRHLKNGVRELKNARFGQAIDMFSMATRLNPELTEAWYYLGKSCQAAGQKSRAVRAFEQAYKLKPTHLPTIISLSRLLAGKKATQRDALELALKAYKIAPNSLNTRENLAYLYLKTNRLTEAITLYKKVIKQKPSHFEALYFLGLSYFSLGENKKAAKYFNLASKYHGDTRTELALANIYEKVESFPKALHHYQKALNYIKPQQNKLALYLKRKIKNLSKKSQARLFTSLSRSLGKRHRQAQFDGFPKSSGVKRNRKYSNNPKYYDTGIDFAGNFKGKYENLTDHKQRNYGKKSIKRNTKALRQTTLEYHLNLASGYLRQNLLMEAEKELNFIISNSDDNYYNVQAQKLLGIIKKKNLEKNKNKSLTHLSLGLDFLSRNKLREAENEFLKVRRLNPNNAQLYKNMAILSIKKGENTVASDYVKKSILLDPNLVDNYIIMALILKSENRNKEAMQFTHKAQKLAEDEERLEFLSFLNSNLKKKLQGSANNFY